MKLFITLAIAFLSFAFINAHGQEKTELYLISSAGDEVGKGELYYFDHEEIDIKIYDNEIHCSCASEDETCYVVFAASANEYIAPGHFINAKKWPYNSGEPGFFINLDDRECKKSNTEFEILELKQDTAGVIQSFAANFIQKCDMGESSLFGTIRYNSNYPLEAKFQETFDENSESRFYLRVTEPLPDSENPFFNTSGAISGERIKLTPLPYGGKGIEISFAAIDRWIFDFAIPDNDDFIPGEYIVSDVYPFQNSFSAGARILKQKNYKEIFSIYWFPKKDVFFDSIKGKFQVLNLERKMNGEINSLALNFIFEAGDATLEGAVRYRSKIPINEHPYISFKNY